MGKNSLVFFLTAILILAFFCLGYSQDNPIKFGLRGGLNMAKVSGDFMMYLEDWDILIENPDKKMRTAFGFGGFVEFWLSPMFAIQANALYSMKGIKLEGSEEFTETYIDPFTGQTFDINYSIDAEETAKLSYLSFPLMGKIAFGENGAIRPYVMAGPEIGFLLSAKNDIKGKGSVEVPSMGISEEADSSWTQDIKDDLESLEFALNFGAGVVIPLGSMEMFIDGRYGLGLAKVNKEGDESYKNNVIYINVGLLFGGK